MAMTEDLSVFFDEADFAVSVTRQRPAVADITFAAIVAIADQEVMQGHVMAGQREARFAPVDVEEGDTLLVAAVPYRVLRVDLDNDGAEMCAYLSPAVA